MWGHHILCAPSTRSYWDAQSKFSDSVVTNSSGTGGTSRVTVNVSRTTPTGTREDWASFTLHFCVGSWLANMVPLTDSQKADAEADLDTFTSAIFTNYIGNKFTLINYTWHDVQFGDQYYGPADRITPKSLVGSDSSARLPDQISTNVTFRTCSRKHWGRYYWMGIGALFYDSSFGRPSNATCDALASATRNLANGVLSNTAATELVVYSHKYAAVLEIARIDCDNVPDVVRRRRAKMASYRKTYTS